MTTTRYYAVLSGNDIASSAQYDVGETIDEAERNAWDQLGDGFDHHTIYIRDRADELEAVSCRKISDNDGWWRP